MPPTTLSLLLLQILHLPSGAHDMVGVIPARMAIKAEISDWRQMKEFFEWLSDGLML